MSNLSNTWLTDRSRYVAGLQQCLRKRYLSYHSITGYGIESARVGLTRQTGIAVHEALALIMVWIRANKHQMPPREMVRAAIMTATTSYRETVERGGGFSDPDAEASRAWTVGEQCALTEALVWGWVRGQLPSFLERFEILMVEEEAPLDLDGGIRYQTRSDLATRERQSGAVCVHDWKTTSSPIDDERARFVSGFTDDIQLAGNVLAIERKLGEPVREFFIHALLKGGRGQFKKKGQPPTGTRQYSELLYARVSPPVPPLQRDPIIEMGGYWADKLPLWEAQLGQPAGQSAIEHWVMDLMPLPALQEHFALLGPYPRPDLMIARLPRQVVAHERGWIEKLWLLHGQDAAEGGGRGLAWSSPEFQALLDEHITPSWDCTAFNERCQFDDLCRFRAGWEQPLAGGRFRTRVPHHTDELEQATARGVK